MRLLIDILQGAGLAGAAGMRPFLPALVRRRATSSATPASSPRGPVS
jgi:hypothetical protein